MSFLFLRHTLIFCGVAIIVALCADVLTSATLLAVAHFSEGGVLFSAKRSGWMAIFAALWLISFLIGLPIARKFSGLPYSLL
jgi:hypothetical protein